MQKNNDHTNLPITGGGDALELAQTVQLREFLKSVKSVADADSFEFTLGTEAPVWSAHDPGVEAGAGSV